MKEKHGNVEKIFEEMKDGVIPDIHYYLNYQCNKCGCKYGKHPEQCGSCGSNSFTQIEPEYQSLT